MLWGYALVWAGQFLKEDKDPLFAKLKFLLRHGLKSTGVGLKELDEMDPAKRDRLARFLADNDLHLMPYFNPGWMNPDRDAVRRNVDAMLAKLEAYLPMLRVPHMVHTGGGGTHRFDREFPLQKQMDLLAEAMPPVARWCHEHGLRLGIENHGDYYVSDLVTLCGRVPHLGIFLDTGNTYLIGEAPLPAFELAAPHVVGSHFKDHRVRPRPDGKPLHFEIGASILGEGDVRLRECYDILVRRTPNPEKLNMQIELIPPSFNGNDPVEAVEKSVAFVKSLGAQGRSI